MKHTKRQAGSKGGKQTLANRGREHFQTIGRKGAAVTWTRYQLSPIGLTEYALIERATGKIVKIVSR